MPCYLGRTAKAAQNGANVGVVWDKNFAPGTGCTPSRGSKAPEAKWSFIQHLATSDGQNPFYEVLPYSPTTLGDPPDVDPAYEPFMPVFNEDAIDDTFNAVYWSTNLDMAMEKWSGLTAG